METKRTYRGRWAGSSNPKEKREILIKAHEEFETSELKKRLDEEWRISGAKVKRPRIKYQPSKIVMVFGKPIHLSIQESNDHYTLTII